VSFTTLSSTVVYRNPWLSLREDRIERPDGSHGLYSVADQPDFALVVPIEDDGFHLVEQYRYPVRGRSWEFPAGSFADGRTGSPEELAAAELAEETGLTAGRLDRLGLLHCANSLISNACHVFVATELTTGEPDRELTEQDMRHRWFSRPELERMMRTGAITDAPTIAAYALLTLHRGPGPSP
jgi:8-oxo-dGTP pyrophosphatase MutT (NUDIX family)